MPRLLCIGSSSGIGAGCCLAFAKEGYDIIGVHLDRRSTMPAVNSLIEDLQSFNVKVDFHNINAIDDQQRHNLISSLVADNSKIDVIIHSLAFGSLGPFVSQNLQKAITTKQMSMTIDVMATSLIWWTRDLVEQGLLSSGGRIFALTSSGNHKVMANYGPVSVAKSALDSIVRQLSFELAPLSITVNSIMAGITETPALKKIPGHEELIQRALAQNPSKRLTTPTDIGACIVELSRPGTYWMTGNIIRVDGGEDIT